MATISYGCGCTFTHSMFGERELCGVMLCMYHIHHPDVLHAKVCDVQDVVQGLIDTEGVPQSYTLYRPPSDVTMG